MYSLKKPKLGTDSKKGWPVYAMQMTSFYIIKDFFLISNYKTCINYSSNYYDTQSDLIDFLEKSKGEELASKKMILANAKELSNWIEEMKNEEYHELYVHSFIGIWSSFEAGLETIFSDYIENDFIVAKKILSKFNNVQYKIEEWPWTKDTCNVLASKLENKAKNLMKDRGHNRNYYERLTMIFEWLNIGFSLEDTDIYHLSEANKMRNIILHSNGVVSSKDVLDFPSLLEWENKTIPFTEIIYKNYYNAIINTLRGLIIEAGKKL